MKRFYEFYAEDIQERNAPLAAPNRIDVALCERRVSKKVDSYAVSTQDATRLSGRNDPAAECVNVGDESPTNGGDTFGNHKAKVSLPQINYASLGRKIIDGLGTFALETEREVKSLQLKIIRRLRMLPWLKSNPSPIRI